MTIDDTCKGLSHNERAILCGWALPMDRMTPYELTKTFLKGYIEICRLPEDNNLRLRYEVEFKEAMSYSMALCRHEMFPEACDEFHPQHPSKNFPSPTGLPHYEVVDCLVNDYSAKIYNPAVKRTKNKIK